MLRCYSSAFLILLCLCGCLAIPAGACTGVVIAGENTVVVGGNEDWTRFDSHVWAEAATDEAFGAVYFGYQIRGEFGPRGRYWFEFQGVNDQGLYFDTFGAPTLDNPNWEGKPSCSEHIEITMMETCGTVVEAVDLLQSMDLSRYRSYDETIFRSNMTFFLADRTGAAALVDADHVHWMEDGVFVTTNFRPSNPSLGGWPCWRYRLAHDMLENDASPTVERVAEILDAAQFSCTLGYGSCTRYSVVCDLTAREAFLYCSGDFDYPARLDLEQLCRQGMERAPIENLVNGSL